VSLTKRPAPNSVMRSGARRLDLGQHLGGAADPRHAPGAAMEGFA